MADPPGPRPDDIAYLTGLVRETDRPRYYATLFAPRTLRADLFALYGFAAEIERIPDLVKDATLGRIRLQWWRDSLVADTGQVGGGETPALRAVLSVVDRHALPLEPLKALMDARSADLHAEPPPTLADMQELIARTQSPLFEMGAALAGERGAHLAQAAHHAGLAYGLARRLSGFAADSAARRSILPQDLLALEGLEPSDVFARQSDERVLKVISAVSHLCLHHLRAARELAPPRGALPVFLPLSVVEPMLARMRQLSLASRRNGVLTDLEILSRIVWARLRAR